MDEIRDRGSVLATETGIQIIKAAKAAQRNHENKQWTYQLIADKSGINKKTVERFFQHKQKVDESNAREICRALGVEFNDVVESRSSVETFKDQEPNDWREICRKLLNQWKGLTTNALTTRNGVRFQLDDMFVPLGVVERRQQPKHGFNDGSPEQGSELYEEKVTPISQHDFEQVLLQRKSKQSQGNRIAIIGEPGAGKTTQLQKIGDWILEKTDGIPFWIPLAALGARSLREYLQSEWLQTAILGLDVTQQDRDELDQLLKTEKVWLLLDGVDEMTIMDALNQIAVQMREGWSQNIRVVLTCRLNVWDSGKNALDGFDVYRNLDFDYPTEVHQFIEKWFATESELQQNLKSALEQPGKDRIRDLVKNPLRLTLLCYSWQLRQGNLPETKAGLYEWFIDAFYKWNKGKAPTKLSTTKRKALNFSLGELAKEAIDQTSSRFRLRENFVNQFLGDADDEDSLFYLALQIGWLNRVGVAEENPLEEVYAFFHPTFQEYFAALAIVDCDFFLNHIPNNPDSGIYRIFEVHWTEVLFLWLGLQDQQSNKSSVRLLLNKLVEFKKSYLSFYWYRGLFLMASITSEFKEKSLIDEIVDQCIDFAFGSLDKESQEWERYPYCIRENAQSHLSEGILAPIIDEKLIKIISITKEIHIKDEMFSFLLNRKKHSNILLSYLKECLLSENERERFMAAHTLLRTSYHEAAVSTLSDLLDSHSQGIKVMTKVALHELENENYINQESCRKDSKENKILDTSLKANVLNLIDYLKFYEDYFGLQELALALEKISSQETNSLNCLLELIRSNADEIVKWEAIKQLEELEPGYPLIKDFLLDLLEVTGDEWIMLGSSIRLLEFDLDCVEALETLAYLLVSAENEEVCEFSSEFIVEYCTEKIHSSNSEFDWRRLYIIQKIIDFLEFDDILWFNVPYVSDCLKDILQQRYFLYIVSRLKFLIESLAREKCKLFEICYEIIWYCAQSMSYPDYYRACESSFVLSVDIESCTD